jgi:hypothetical protein
VLAGLAKTRAPRSSEKENKKKIRALIVVRDSTFSGRAEIKNYSIHNIDRGGSERVQLAPLHWPLHIFTLALPSAPRVAFEGKSIANTRRLT